MADPYMRLSQVMPRKDPQAELDAMLRALPPNPNMAQAQTQTPAPAQPARRLPFQPLTPQQIQQLTPQQRQAYERAWQEEQARQAYERQQELYRNTNMQQMFQQQMQQGWGSQ